MVNIDCGTYTPAGVNAIADLCEARFRAGGWTIERPPHAPADGAPQLGRPPDRPAARRRRTRVLLVGHMDTVFDEGTVAERPFRIEGTIARGPGVSDMKGGSAGGVLRGGGAAGGRVRRVRRAHLRLQPRRGDRLAVLAGRRSRELAPGHDVAFVLEGARRKRRHRVARARAITDYEIVVQGRAAHAGVEPEKGRSAILQAAHTVIALQATERPVAGRHRERRRDRVAARARTSSPTACRLEVDLRVARAGHVGRGGARRSSGSAPSASCPTSRSRSSRTAGTGRWRRARARRVWSPWPGTIAAELGFALHDAATGGASDANTTSAAGTPTLDGLGPIGGDDHAPAEWLDLASVVPRVTLLAGLIARA